MELSRFMQVVRIHRPQTLWLANTPWVRTCPVNRAFSGRAVLPTCCEERVCRGRFLQSADPHEFMGQRLIGTQQRNVVCY